MTSKKAALARGAESLGGGKMRHLGLRAATRSRRAGAPVVEGQDVRHSAVQKHQRMSAMNLEDLSPDIELDITLLRRPAAQVEWLEKIAQKAQRA